MKINLWPIFRLISATVWTDFGSILEQDDGDLEVGARDALAAHYASLGGNFSKHERTKRTLDHEAAAAPPTLESFAAPAQAVYEAARLGHETMAYGELSLHVWLICQVFGVATRARTLRTARWGHEIVRLPGDSEPEPEPEPEQKEEGQQQQGLVWNCCDWRICVDDTVQPSAVPVFVQLSHLQPLASEPVCLLQPTLVSQALGWLFARTGTLVVPLSPRAFRSLFASALDSFRSNLTFQRVLTTGGLCFHILLPRKRSSKRQNSASSSRQRLELRWTVQC